MRRIAVVGPGGAGKSVLATRLGAQLGIPVTHLDVLYWRANWEPAPREEAVARVAEIVASDDWILDGLRWIARYPFRDRPQVLGLLAGLDADVSRYRLRTPEQPSADSNQRSKDIDIR